MSKVNSIGIQYANGTVRMYLNEPVVGLEIGKPDDTCPYRVKINGDTIECRDIAKLIIDNCALSYPDPYIKIPSIRNKEELAIWRSKLGLSAFSDIWRIVSDNASDMIDVFSKTELKSDEEIEKAKKVIEMQVAKEMHKIRQNQPEEEPKEEESNIPDRTIGYLGKPGTKSGGYFPGKYSLDEVDTTFRTYDEWKKW